MSFFFANPWGLLALAAIPALVAIHFLQEQSRRVRASTLFLLEHARPTSEGGFRIERFQNSLPFWMQVLAASALAWLLADPRWVRAEPRQTVAVVLDSSASMQAFRQETLDALAKRLRGWGAAASRTDWHLLETGPRRPPLYAGPSLDELLDAAADRWQPVLGSHPFADAVGAARALVPAGAGGVLLVTDRPSDVPADVAVLSVGTPLDNVGFSGGRVDVADGRATWRVLITNHGDAAQARELTLRAAGSGDLAEGKPLASPQRIELAAGQSRSFTAAWPADGTARDDPSQDGTAQDGPGRIVLTLGEDRFTLDDTLPLVRPMLRRVRLANRLPGPAGDLLDRMLAAADGVERVADAAEADLVVDRLGAEPTGHAVLVAVADPVEATSGETTDADAPAEGPSPRPRFDPAWVAAEDHPLVRDLGWGSLLSGPASETRLSASDTPLLWKDGRPLAFLQSTRRGNGQRAVSLVLNWDLANSTAARTAAAVVLLARFVEQVRQEIPRSWTVNVETGQAIPLPGGRQTRAPETPGFFAVPMTLPMTLPVASPTTAASPIATGEQRPVLSGAAQFADARECDFRDASPLDTLDTIRMEQIVKRSVADPWAPLWIAVAAGALLLAWSWRRRS